MYVLTFRHYLTGSNVEMSGAYVWDGCVIADGCRLERCLLDAGVQLQPSVSVKPGCVLAQHVSSSLLSLVW